MVLFLKICNKIWIALFFRYLNFIFLGNYFDLLVDKIKGNDNFRVILEIELKINYHLWTHILLLLFKKIKINLLKALWYSFWKDISVKFLCSKTATVEATFTELNLQKRTWCSTCAYNYNRNKIINVLDIFKKA